MDCGRFWGAPACWKPILAPICGGYWAWKGGAEDGLGCGGIGGCNGICGIPGACNGWRDWLEAFGNGVWWCGCKEEWSEDGGTFGIRDDCGRDTWAISGVRCPLGRCGICKECAGIGCGWWLTTGMAADDIGTGGWFWCFLGGIWVWDTPAWSCIPASPDNNGAGWMFDCCVGCPDCCMFCEIGGWIFGIWKQILFYQICISTKSDCYEYYI